MEEPKKYYNCWMLLLAHSDRVQEGFAEMGASPDKIPAMTRDYIVDEFKRGSRLAQRSSRIFATIYVAAAAPCALSLAHGLITNAPTTTFNVIASLFFTVSGAKAFFYHRNYMRRAQESNAQTATLTEQSHPGDECAYANADARIRKRFAERGKPKSERGGPLWEQEYVPHNIIIPQSLVERRDTRGIHRAISEGLKP